jgi:hypothetical protein
VFNSLPICDDSSVEPGLILDLGRRLSFKSGSFDPISTLTHRSALEITASESVNAACTKSQMPHSIALSRVRAATQEPQ